MDSPLSQGTRSLGNGRQSPTSPLKLFGQAKKKINDVFIEIAAYIDESHAFLTGKNRISIAHRYRKSI